MALSRNAFIKLTALSPLAMTGAFNVLQKLTDELTATEMMPALFLGHGNPMNTIEDNEFVQGFKQIATTYQKPTAILCISAHWYTKGTMVTVMEQPQTIHDFYGFPDELAQFQYPAKGNPSLAKETADLLSPVEVISNEDWGLDHGAWSVLTHIAPQADIPVIQMSIDYQQPASYHFALAKKLQTLRSKGVLIVGSGNIIHNLGLVDFQNIDKVDYGYDWALEAHTKLHQLILDGDYNSLIDYQKLGKAVQLAIPTPDHYLPFIYTLGLKSEKEKITLFNDKLLAGSLSMTSVKIG